jgi:hypothetical protein
MENLMTLTIDLVDSGALKLLHDLESLNLIRVNSPPKTAAETSEPGGQETLSPYTPDPFPALEELKAGARRKTAERFAEMERTGVDPLARFAGRLKNVFPEDGMEYQRRMRDEWPD